MAPGKRPRSSMTPVIVLTGDGRFAGAFGSAGGNADPRLCRQVDGRGDRLEAADAAGDWPRRTSSPAGGNFNGEVTKFAPGNAGRARSAKGIDLQPGQGEDSGVHGGDDPRWPSRWRLRPAPRGRGAVRPPRLARRRRCPRLRKRMAIWLQAGWRQGPAIRRAMPGPHRPSPNRAGRASRRRIRLPGIVGIRDSAGGDQRDRAAAGGTEGAQGLERERFERSPDRPPVSKACCRAERPDGWSWCWQ